MKTTYEITVDGIAVATMTADFAQASSPLLLNGDSTPFQVADARHRKMEAAEMLLQWSHNDSANSLCEIDEDGDIVGAIEVAEVVAAE